MPKPSYTIDTLTYLSEKHPQHHFSLIVGEDNKEGYSSAMIVQQITPTIIELRAKEIEMLGTPLTVDFRTIVDQGTQQILLSVRKR